MLYEIPQNNPGVNIKYRLIGSLFNLSRLRSKNLTHITTVTQLQYADNNAAHAHTTNHLQQSVNNFHAAYSRFGLTVNTAKTKILAQPPSRSALPDFLILIVGKDIDRVEHFPYLGSLFSVQCTSAKDVENRLTAAHAAFGRLTSRVFLNKDLNYTTKLMVYHAVVASTLLYGCETCTLYRRDLKKLEQFHGRKLRQLLQINWEDHVTKNAVLERGRTRSIEAIIISHRLRWSGHVVRMDETRLPREILFRELPTGKRPHGRPLERYKNQLKQTPQKTNIDVKTWETIARDHPLWRRTIHQGSDHFHRMRREEAEEKRQRRKARAVLPHALATIFCDQCPRLFWARIGLISHKPAFCPS